MVDIYEIDEYQLNGVDLYMKLASTTNPCVLISDEAITMLKILIKDVAYKVLTVEVVDPVVLVNNVNQHESTPASYYFSRSEVKMNIIIKSSTPFYWDQIFPQAISSKIVIYFANQRQSTRSTFNIFVLRIWHSM